MSYVYRGNIFDADPVRVVVKPDCGTRTAYQRHLRHGEPTDDACRAANAEYRKAAHYRKAAK